MVENNMSEIQQAVLKAIAYHFPQAKVILFGSRARGTHRPGSDVDIAIDLGAPIKLRDMARMRVTLENLPLPINIDIVDMHNIPQELHDIVMKEGIVWTS